MTYYLINLSLDLPLSYIFYSANIVIFLISAKDYVIKFELGSVSKSVSGRNSKKGPAKILTGPNKFVILGDKT